MTARDARGNVSPPSNEAGVAVVADTTPPSVSINTPAANATLSGSTPVSASVSDNVGVVGVQFLLDGAPLGSEVAVSPFSTTWNTTGSANGAHTLTARARDAAGNLTTSAPVAVRISNTAATGPVLAYSFNGSGATVADSSGNGNTGTITKGTWLATGKYGRALSFSGTGYVTTPNSPSIDISGTGFTLEFWAYRKDTASSDQAVISKDGTTQFYQFSFEFQNSGSSRMPVFGLLLADGTLQGLPVNVRYVANQWQHYALTYDGQTMKAYVGGTLTAARSLPGSLKAEGNALHIGADRLLGQRLKGAIDDLRIYNRALAQAEIQADMGSGLP